MAKSGPVTVLVTYRPKKGKEKELRALVERHWEALDRLGLVTGVPVQVWRATDKSSGSIAFVETFQWRDEEAPRLAHEIPEIMAIWEPMITVLDDLQIQFLEPLSGFGGRRAPA